MFQCTICALEHLCTNLNRKFVHKQSTNILTSVCCPSVRKQLTNISDVHLLSVCCTFLSICCSMYRTRMFLCTICALEHLCTNRQPKICAQTIDEYFDVSLLSICAQTVDKYFDVSLLSVCAQTVDRYIGMKRKRKFNENQENNTNGECKK